MCIYDCNELICFWIYMCEYIRYKNNCDLFVKLRVLCHINNFFSSSLWEFTIFLFMMIQTGVIDIFNDLNILII